jgi:imidazolonepropionase-like amidohydrolase
MRREFLIAGLVLSCLPLAGTCAAQVGPNDTVLSPAKTIAIVGGKLLTITHGTIENGVVIMSGGKIVAVGPAASTKVPGDAQVFDAKGMTVYPGLFDAETHLGLTEVGSDQNSNDLAEPSDEIMPHMHVADAFHAETVRIPVARLNGITNAIVAPASQDSIAGQDASIQLYGRDRDAMLLGRDVALAMNFEGSVRRKANYDGPAKFPTTRMGLATQIRQAFLDAQAYEAEMQAAARPQRARAQKRPEARSIAALPERREARRIKHI